MLETERLLLRPLDKKDVDRVYAMRSDPEVMRFIREPQNRNETVNWIKLVSGRWRAEKLGFCALIEKQTDEFLGWCGVWRLPETDELEVGYAIVKRFWGCGLAPEAAAKFIEYAFAEIKPEKIVAVAEPENAASRRVMEKLGMRFVKTGIFYERELVQYAIGKNEWRARSAKTNGKR